MEDQKLREYYNDWSRLESIVVQAARNYATEHKRYTNSDLSAESHERMLAAQTKLLDAVHALLRHTGCHMLGDETYQKAN